MKIIGEICITTLLAHRRPQRPRLQDRHQAAPRLRRVHRVQLPDPGAGHQRRGQGPGGDPLDQRGRRHAEGARQRDGGGRPRHLHHDPRQQDALRRPRPGHVLRSGRRRFNHKVSTRVVSSTMSGCVN